MVPVDLSPVKDRPVIEFGMEIFVADQYGEFIISDSDGDFKMAFLKIRKLIPPFRGVRGVNICL